MSSRLCCTVVGLALSCSAARAAGTLPPTDAGPVRVEVVVYVLDISRIDSAAQSFTADVYLEAAWEDPRLVHDGPGPAYPATGDVWQPNLQFTNARQLTPSLPDRLEVSPGGEVRYRQRFWGEFSQPMQLRDFPWDTQQLTIRVVTSGLTPDQVELVPTSHVGTAVSADLSVPDFDLTGHGLVAETCRPTSARRSVACVSNTLLAKRKSGYFTIKVIAPLLLIVIMSWTVFWLDPADGGPQIGVATTSMLTVIAFRFSIDESLPKISYLTRLDAIILASTVLIFLSLIEVTITTRMAHSNRLKAARRLDQWSRLVFPVALVSMAVLSWGR